MIKSQDLTVLVSTCKEYADVLYCFEKLFKKFWMDCPYPVILVTDCKAGMDYQYDNVIEIRHKGNGKRIYEALKEIKTEYILLLLDDFFLCDYVDNGIINKILSYMKKYNAGNIRFIKNIFSNSDILFDDEEGLLVSKPGNAYRLSVGCGVWDKQFLESILKYYDNLWSFEREGSFNPRTFERLVLVSSYQEFPCIDAVHKGKYEQFAASLLSMNHLDIDQSKRKVMSNKDIVLKYLKGAVLDINPNLVVKMQNILHIGFK